MNADYGPCSGITHFQLLMSVSVKCIAVQWMNYNNY